MTNSDEVADVGILGRFGLVRPSPGLAGTPSRWRKVNAQMWSVRSTNSGPTLTEPAGITDRSTGSGDLTDSSERSRMVPRMLRERAPYECADETNAGERP
jgi:hypothetical protein